MVKAGFDYHIMEGPIGMDVMNGHCLLVAGITSNGTKAHKEDSWSIDNTSTTADAIRISRYNKWLRINRAFWGKPSDFSSHVINWMDRLYAIRRDRLMQVFKASGFAVECVAHHFAPWFEDDSGYDGCFAEIQDGWWIWRRELTNGLMMKQVDAQYLGG